MPLIGVDSGIVTEGPLQEAGLPRSQVLAASLFFSLPVLLWIMLWFSINTGPWVFTRTPTTFLGWLHYLRAAFPFVVLLVSGMLSFSSQETDVKIVYGPMKLWLVYGLIGLIACMISSPRPLSAAYWGIAYLSVFAATRFFLQGPDPLKKAITLNYLSWIITALFLAILVFMARDALFVDNRSGMTGYGIVGRVGTVADMAMSRSSGMARFAAVPAVASFVFIWQSRGIFRLFHGAVFLLSGALVYFMQSRGAIFGLAFALFFIMLFMGVRSRRLGALFLVLLGLVLYTGIIPEQRVEQVSEHITRGQDEEQFRSLTGRTRAWEKGWKQALKSPVWGWGPQADRYLIKEHVHNTYMYTLMSAGFAGAAAFAGGLLWAWVLFLRAIMRGFADRFDQRFFLIQAGGILAFFTVRSIPEVCGAMFGVDLMVMLPVLAYLVVLDQKGREFEERTDDGGRRTENREEWQND